MKAAVIGLTFGFLAIWVGLFFGLQVSPMVANILLFPVIAVSYLVGTPIGAMSTPLTLAAFFLHCLVWSAIFYLGWKVTRRA